MDENWLREDKLPSQLIVVLSPTINLEINEIEYLNWRKTDEINKWHNYLDSMLQYISNPSIAWDYAGRYVHLQDGETYINEIGYDVGFIVETNETQTFVKVFRLSLKAEEYGLQLPTNENRKYNLRNNQYNTIIMNTRKQRIRLTESDLRNIINKCVNESLNEISPQLAARYEGGRQAQADNASNPQEKFKYQQKTNAGGQYAQDDWNKQYGFDFNNGAHDWGYQKMRGQQGFTHNRDAKYGVDYQGERSNWDGNGYKHTNMAYNPKSNTVWQGNGRGNSNVAQHHFDTGDNGAYRTANEMEKGSQEVYNKYRNQGMEESIYKSVGKVLRNESLDRIVRESINRVLGMR